MSKMNLINPADLSDASLKREFDLLPSIMAHMLKAEEKAREPCAGAPTRGSTGQ